MEAELRINRPYLGKMTFVLIIGFFMTAMMGQAQVLGLGAPNFNAQPVGTNVQNEDTVTFTTSAYCTLGDISSVTWGYSNGKSGSLPTNATVTVSGLGGTTISSTLTLKGVSSACAGSYYVEVTDQLLDGLLGLLQATATSTNASLSIIPTVTGVTSQSGMVAKGFKVQFTAPIGSNVVIQATSDMNNWSSVCTNVCTTGSITFTDAVAKTVSCRFYRAMIK